MLRGTVYRRQIWLVLAERSTHKATRELFSLFARRRAEKFYSERLQSERSEAWSMINSSVTKTLQGELTRWWNKLPLLVLERNKQTRLCQKVFWSFQVKQLYVWISHEKHYPWSLVKSNLQRCHIRFDLDWQTQTHSICCTSFACWQHESRRETRQN